MFVFTQCACNERCLPKEAHFKFGFHSGNITRSQLQTFRKNTKNMISCLKLFVVAVWICICLNMKYLRIWITKSV